MRSLMTHVYALEAIAWVRFEVPSSYLQAILKFPARGAEDLCTTFELWKLIAVEGTSTLTTMFYTAGVDNDLSVVTLYTTLAVSDHTPVSTRLDELS